MGTALGLSQSSFGVSLGVDLALGLEMIPHPAAPRKVKSLAFGCSWNWMLHFLPLLVIYTPPLSKRV